MKRYLFISMLIVGCGKFESTRQVEADLETYVETFESLYGSKINFPVKFAVLPEHIAGLCYMYSNGERYVEIDSEYWPKMSYYGKEELVFHELGHCELNRDHNNKLNSLGRQESIMYYMVFGDLYYYVQNRQAYIDELFDTSKPVRGFSSIKNIDSDVIYIE